MVCLYLFIVHSGQSLAFGYSILVFNSARVSRLQTSMNYCRLLVIILTFLKINKTWMQLRQKMDLKDSFLHSYALHSESEL